LSIAKRFAKKEDNLVRKWPGRKKMAASNLKKSREGEPSSHGRKRRAIDKANCDKKPDRVGEEKRKS